MFFDAPATVPKGVSMSRLLSSPLTTSKAAVLQKRLHDFQVSDVDLLSYLLDRENGSTHDEAMQHLFRRTPLPASDRVVVAEIISRLTARA